MNKTRPTEPSASHPIVEIEKLIRKRHAASQGALRLIRLFLIKDEEATPPKPPANN